MRHSWVRMARGQSPRTIHTYEWRIHRGHYATLHLGSHAIVKIALLFCTNGEILLNFWVNCLYVFRKLSHSSEHHHRWCVNMVHGRRPTFRKCARSCDSGIMDRERKWQQKMFFFSDSKKNFVERQKVRMITDDILADLLGLPPKGGNKRSDLPYQPVV